MFKTQRDLINALLQIEVDGDDIPVPPAQRMGVLARIFGKPSSQPGVSATFPEDVAKAIAAMAKPSLQLELDGDEGEDKIPLGLTKIGGRPDLPEGVDWPMRPAMPDVAASYAKGSDIKVDDLDWSFLDSLPEETAAEMRSYMTPEFKETMQTAWSATDPAMAAFYAQPAPLPFLAQISFADFAKHGVLGALPYLPTSGVLYIFYDMVNQVWGFDTKDTRGFKLIWFDGDESTLTRRDIPDALQEIAARDEWAATVIKPRGTWPEVRLSLPDTVDDEIYTMPEMSEAVSDALREWTMDYNGELSSDHRIGGWPNVIQNPMETECALVTAGKYCGDGDAYSDPANAEIIATSKDWIMLAQISSEEDLGYMFGDSGKLYVWITKQDLAARDFDKAWIVVQCY